MFNPVANEELKIGAETYRIAEHPAAPGMPYGQEGRAAVVYKLVTNEAHHGDRVELPRGDSPDPIVVESGRPTSLGRAPENTVRLPSSGVSRMHATLELRDGRLFFKDNRSSNKSFLNDEAVAPDTWIELLPGSRVRLGTEDTSSFRVPLVHSRCRALKVFKPQYRVPALVSLTERLGGFASAPGLGVCARTVLVPQAHAEVLRTYEDLIYAVCMGWVEGPTWMEVVLEPRAISSEMALRLAQGFASVMAGLEQRGIAHCDMSGPNIMVPALADEPEEGALPVVLIDVEQLYGPGLNRPEAVPAGSAGYAPRNVPETGLWSADADRFGGAVVLAEMLAWCSEEVRSAAWGESYFDPSEMQTPCARYELMAKSLQRMWGDGPARIFERAWRADKLSMCPTFGEWMLALSDCRFTESTMVPTLVPTVVPVSTGGNGAAHAAAPAPPVAAPAPAPPLAVPTPVAVSTPAPAPAAPSPAPPRPEPEPATSNAALTAALADACKLDDEGNDQGALEAYRKALSLATNGPTRKELELIVADVEKRIAARQGAPVPVAAPAPAPAPVPAAPRPAAAAPPMSKEELEELRRKVQELDPSKPTVRPAAQPEAKPSGTLGYVIIAVLAVLLVIGLIVFKPWKGRSLTRPAGTISRACDGTVTSSAVRTG